MKEIRERVLNDDEFVISETFKIQKLYRLKHEIRYGLERVEDIQTESVAEHIYGIHIIATYFLPLEDQGSTWDKTKILEMITYHDIDEVKTGDSINFKKTEQFSKEELGAALDVLSNSSSVIKKTISSIVTEYHKQQSIEAKFVKAIDAVEPLFQLFNENGRKTLLQTKATYKNNRDHKDPYLTDFPIVERFSDVISIKMLKQGYFHSG